MLVVSDLFASPRDMLTHYTHGIRDIFIWDAGGLPFVLIGDERARCIFAVRPPDACLIMSYVLRQTSAGRMLAGLLRLARTHSST